MNKIKYINIPNTCPICGRKTEIVKDNDSEVLMCSNPDCRGKLLGKLVHFCSKNAINIEGMSEATLQFLINRGWVKSFHDIYMLDWHWDEWIKCDGFGEKSVLKLLENIKKSKNTTLDRFIYSLSIPLIGRSASKTIAKEFGYGNAEGFYDAWDDYDFTVLDDFGEFMNKSMHEYYKEYYKEISELMEEFVFHNTEKISNKTFVITGSLIHYKNRDELISVIESRGGKVSGSVSVKTSYLINNDTQSSSSKNQKAKKLNIPIISEQDFINMIS